jgi:hypothetical protein
VHGDLHRVAELAAGTTTAQRATTLGRPAAGTTTAQRATTLGRPAAGTTTAQRATTLGWPGAGTTTARGATTLGWPGARLDPFCSAGGAADAGPLSTAGWSPRRTVCGFDRRNAHARTTAWPARGTLG